MMMQQKNLSFVYLLIVAACHHNVVAAFVAGPSTTTPWARSSSSSSSSLQAQEVDCLVVGSGVSGSTLAFNLVKNQKIDNILMVERNEQVGGNLISKENEGKS